MDKKKILETLQMQPLSEEEKSSRHILGRLYGPIATSLESTRNGRKYNADLWKKALADDIFKEKIANKSLFLELGHPADREETDMEKVCACIPEMPRVVDGDLYAYVDILDTKNGRLLKTLCDYGFVPGISSRGSGDIMANDEVDPETFFLETWDIVQLPAVKKARLSMCESYNGKTLKTALKESYDAANEEEKKEMKETLNNLDIKIDGSEEIKEAVDITNIPESTDEADINEILIENSEERPADEETVEDEIIEEDPADEEISSEENIEKINDKIEEPVAEEEVKVELTSDEVAAVVQETAAEVADMVQEVVEPTEEQEEEIAEKVDEIVVDKVEDICPECEVVVEKEDSDEDVEETDSTDIKEEQPEAEEAEGEDKEAKSDDEDEQAEDEPEEANDDGVEGYIESLKTLIRQKDLLESEVKTLKNEKTVSDAEVKKLKEELNKYKAGFARISELASKSTKFEKEVQGLNEQLTQKESEIKNLRSKIVNTTKLTESVNARETEVKSLTEKLDAMQKDLTATETKLNEQKVHYSGKLTEAIDVAKAYKSRFESVMSHYIESKASMLGVRTTDITSRLNENYSIEDVDAVCEDLLEAPNHFSSSLFEDFNRGGKVKFHEAKTAKVRADEDDLSDLLEFAGLKK